MPEIIREPYGIVHKDPSPLKDVYGGTTGAIWVECMRIRPISGNSECVIVFSHPIGGGSFLPLVTALAKKGHHIIYCNPRYRGNDTALIMEKCVLDLGACIKDARKRFGYTKVILGGWSGGGSLSLFYQEQAEQPNIIHTPAGDEVDLVGAQLVPADAILLLAAHVSRSVTMTEWIDPSILDENQPYKRDINLNIYDPNCPHQPPYTDEFVAAFRAAQIARNQRITDWVKEKLTTIKASDNPHAEHCFCVYGTMSDIRWTDPIQDPSDRPPHTSYMGIPKIANDGPVGLGRFTNLRSWLSQWSYSESNANGVKNAQHISCPVLVINNTADLACTPSHAKRLYDAVASKDKQKVDIVGADHYYIKRRGLLPKAISVISKWLDERQLG